MRGTASHARRNGPVARAMQHPRALPRGGGRGARASGRVVVGYKPPALIKQRSLPRTERLSRALRRRRACLFGHWRREGTVECASERIRVGGPSIHSCRRPRDPGIKSPYSSATATATPPSLQRPRRRQRRAGSPGWSHTSQRARAMAQSSRWGGPLQPVLPWRRREEPFRPDQNHRCHATDRRCSACALSGAGAPATSGCLCTWLRSRRGRTRPQRAEGMRWGSWCVPGVQIPPTARTPTCGPPRSAAATAAAARRRRRAPPSSPLRASCRGRPRPQSPPAERGPAQRAARAAAAAASTPGRAHETGRGCPNAAE